MLMKAEIEVLNTPGNGKYWTAGETILYDYILTNDTDVYFYDINFVANLTDVTMIAPDLVPGEIWSRKATHSSTPVSYIVTEEDIAAERIVETLSGTWEENSEICSISVSNIQWTIDLSNVPIVPNLYEAPLSPIKGDCYYNITVNKYYIYDGIEWLEAKIEGNATDQDMFQLKYSTDGGLNYTTETYTDFDALCTKMNSNDIKTATDIIITMPPQKAILIPRSNNLSLDGVALLKLNAFTLGKKDVFELKYSKDGGNTFTTEEYNDFFTLINRTNSSVMNGVTDIEISMREVEDPNIIKYGTSTTQEKDVFYLSYSKDNGETFVIQKYDDFSDLTSVTHSSAMEGVTDISIRMDVESGSGDKESSIVGKIYPKIIFNQQLVENLVMNTNQVNQNIFDGVLTFYNQDWEPSDEGQFRVSYKNEGDTEWITKDFTSFETAIAYLNGWRAEPYTATELKFEEISSEE